MKDNAKVLIFDFDGVIVDSLDIMHNFINRYAREFGISWLTRRINFTRLFDGNLFEELVKIGFPKHEVENLMVKVETEFAHEYQNVRLVPGIRKVVNALAIKYPLCIATSNLTKTVKAKLAAEKFESIARVLGADVDLSKENKIKQIKNEYPKSKYYFVSDTLGDLLEAKRTCVLTVGITWGYHSLVKITSAKPDFIAREPEELFKLLQ